MEVIPTVTIDMLKDKCIYTEPTAFWDGYLKNVAWLPITTTMSELYKGHIGKQVRKTIKQGYYCKSILPQEYCQEIHDINFSKPIHQGGPMRGQSWYVQTVEQLSNELNFYKKEGCPHHYSEWFGVFTKDSKMVGFIKLNRFGEFSYYGIILGHGDYLKDGIMYLLHFYIQRLLRESNDTYYKGILGTAYHTYYHWGDANIGLEFWKKKAGFIPVHINRKV